MASKSALSSAYKKAKVSSERPDYKVKPISAEARAKGKETMKKAGKMAKDVAKNVVKQAIPTVVGQLAGGVKKKEATYPAHTATHRTIKPKNKSGR